MVPKLSKHFYFQSLGSLPDHFVCSIDKTFYFMFMVSFSDLLNLGLVLILDLVLR